MIIALWVINILLAIAFAGAGAMKLARPRHALQTGGMSFVEDFSDTSVKAIGAVEIVGAIGLILPLATGIAPVLTPVASLGLALTMLGATVVHLRRKESAAASAVLLLLSVVSAVLGFAALA